MTALVRSAALTHFDAVARECGLDAQRLLRAAGLPSRALDEPELKVPAGAVGRLLELAADAASEPAFGLRMAQMRRLSNLGPLALIARDQPTLGSALEALMRHIHLHNEAIAVQVVPSGGQALIKVELAGRAGRPQPQASELSLGVIHRLLTTFLGAGWKPRRVCFRHEAPRDASLHRRYFGTTVAFGQAFDGIVCDARDLESANPGADPVMARYTGSLLQERRGRPVTMRDRVRQVAILLLPRGHCRVERVAQHLGVDRRTVARWLAEEGTTFSAVVDALRDELLERYLDEDARTLAEIAGFLGFAAASGFARWHRQRHGAPARRRLGAGSRRRGGTPAQRRSTGWP